MEVLISEICKFSFSIALIMIPALRKDKIYFESILIGQCYKPKLLNDSLRHKIAKSERNRGSIRCKPVHSKVYFTNLKIMGTNNCLSEDKSKESYNKTRSEWQLKKKVN